MNNCILRDTTIVIDEKSVDVFPQDTFVCEDENLILKTDMPGTYQWSDGSTGKELPVSVSGNYSVSITNDCSTYYYFTEVLVEDCSCNWFVPNVFSPNADGINDCLEIFNDCDFKYKIINFSVFDRWGSCVYGMKEDGLISWGGKVNGNVLPNGVYVWLLEYEIIRNGMQERLVEGGDVTLLR